MVSVQVLRRRYERGRHDESVPPSRSPSRPMPCPTCVSPRILSSSPRGHGRLPARSDAHYILRVSRVVYHNVGRRDGLMHHAYALFGRRKQKRCWTWGARTRTSLVAALSVPVAVSQALDDEPLHDLSLDSYTTTLIRPALQLVYI